MNDEWTGCSVPLAVAYIMIFIQGGMNGKRFDDF